MVETLTDHTAINRAADGDFHATLRNSKDYGRDVFFVDGQLYLRPRYGKFHRRPPVEQADPARIQDEMGGALAATLVLLAPGSALKDGGTRDVAGRAARVVELSSGEGRRPSTGYLPIRPGARAR